MNDSPAMTSRQFRAEVVETLADGRVRVRTQDGAEFTATRDTAAPTALKYAHRTYPGQYDSVALDF